MQWPRIFGFCAICQRAGLVEPSQFCSLQLDGHENVTVVAVGEIVGQRNQCVGDERGDSFQPNNCVVIQISYNAGLVTGVEISMAMR